ncbi:unnamed protein product [Onchocerca flexuosa]|uniref:UmuC domain-containing protein n=1 Tax=Onchocerca flexuosa TaxID=387005 RepID=A0A183HH04_9BILA|nr:unnamed protein product [Onchocerca flexuosa]
MFDRKSALVKISKRQTSVAEATGTPLFGEQARTRASSNDIALKILKNFNKKKSSIEIIHFTSTEFYAGTIA